MNNIKLTSYEKYKNFNITFRDLLYYFLEFDDYCLRKCYSCGNNMRFLECNIENKYNVSIRNLIKIWTNNNVKLFCCRCNSILKSFPEEDQEYLIKNKEKIANIEYACIVIDPDVESVFSECYGDIEESKNLTTFTLHSYPDGEDLNDFISPEDGIWIPKNYEIENIITEKTENGYKSTVKIKENVNTKVKIKDIVNKEDLNER